MFKSMSEYLLFPYFIYRHAHIYMCTCYQQLVFQLYGYINIILVFNWWLLDLNRVIFLFYGSVFVETFPVLWQYQEMIFYDSRSTTADCYEKDWGIIL